MFENIYYNSSILKNRIYLFLKQKLHKFNQIEKKVTIEMLISNPQMNKYLYYIELYKYLNNIEYVIHDDWINNPLCVLHCEYPKDEY